MEEFKGPWELYDYVNARGANEIKQWTQSLQKTERTKLNQKLDMLRKTGPGLAPNLLAGPISENIYKLRVKGRVQLRPMLCKGPVSNGREFTLLLGAFEVGNVLDPQDAPERAETNRAAILQDINRRKNHERVT
jgi:hypothetical protein